LPAAEAIAWASKLSDSHSSISFDGKLTYPAYAYIPSKYLLCENDKIITPDMQRSMVEAAVKETGKTIDVISVAAGHGSTITVPDKVVEVIRMAAGEMI